MKRELVIGSAIAVGVLAVGWFVAGRIRETAAAATGAVVAAGAGVVLGIGDAVGLPRTEESECERAIREGRTWDASFVCPAKRFVAHLLE